jgi:hypothetical protein
MKNLVQLLLCFLVAFNCLKINAKNDNVQPINAILGDISFFEKYSCLPTQSASEVLRIQTHLEYVESLLRNASTAHLTKKQKKNRQKAIENLHFYWTAGVFPENREFLNDRKPCFIDAKGNLCAVGYLIEQSVGRGVAEQINARYQYEYLMDMEWNVIDEWIASSGLTKLECAMIQPSYGPTPTENYITPGFGFATAVFSGANVALSVMNISQINRQSKGLFTPILGMVLGAGQITLGALNFPEIQYGWSGSYINEAQRNYALVNVALGTSSVIFSTWSLITRKPAKTRNVSWNVGAFPTNRNQLNVVFSFRKSF